MLQGRQLQPAGRGLHTEAIGGDQCIGSGLLFSHPVTVGLEAKSASALMLPWYSPHTRLLLPARDYKNHQESNCRQDSKINTKKNQGRGQGEETLPDTIPRNKLPLLHACLLPASDGA